MATVIVSDETIRNLIEAHASLSAWYYQMSEALRSAGKTVDAPTDEQRLAFVQQLAKHYPELAAAASSITEPRPYLPPPVVPTPSEVVENEGVSTPEPPADYQPTPQRVPGAEPVAVPPPPPPAMAGDGPPAADTPPAADAPPAPPPIVDPSKVKYE